MEMMPQKEVNEAGQQQAHVEFAGYEGNAISPERHHYETFYGQDMREGASGKVYPLPRDRTNMIRLALVAISLVMLLLFGYLFVIVVGGATGTISFIAACFVLCCIIAYAATMGRTGQ